MKKRRINILLILLLANSAIGQGLYNYGNINVSGGSMVITGNYQNESAGAVTLDGTISLTGNWTNNAANNVIINADGIGTVIFDGTGIQSIGGSSNFSFIFEGITIGSSATVEVTAGMGVTAEGTCDFSNSPLILRTTTTPFRPEMATFINHGSVVGNITMEMSYSSTGTTTAGAGRGLYFSSPISNATSTIFNVAHATNLLWYQNEAIRQYIKVTANNTPLTVAKGYILRAPIDTVVNFTGTPNTASFYTNNNIPRAVTGQFYLFGNPYPAVIDWDAIATKTNLTNTIWYQTSSTAGTPMVVDTWNGDSQVGTANNGTAAVDGMIPPLQSFWVQCTSVGQIGTLTVEDNDRTHNWGSSKFLKSKAQSSDKSIIRLALFTDSKKDETIIVESESALDEFDNWDSRKMLVKDANRAEVYTLSPDKNNKNLVIQSVKPVSTEKIIRLGISIGTSGEYKFSSDFSSSIRTSNVYLEDKQQNITQDLFANPEYTFTSNAVDDTTRFIIHFLPAPTVIAKSNIATCYPNLVDLTSTDVTEGSASGLTFTYWTNNTATIPYTTPTTAETGTYYIKGTAQNGSYSIAGPISVSINPLPIVITNNPAEVIEPGTVDLTVPEITLGSSDGLVYSYWTDASATIPYNTPQFATQGDYYIKGTYENTGCYSIAGPVKVIVTPNSTDAGINIANNSLIYAFADQIHIQNFDLNSTIYIFDILGRQQYYGITKSDHVVINSSFKSGIYIVRVINKDVVKSKKVYIR